MAEIIRRLPADLINIIISYTYTPQPIEIRKDIRSYFETKKTIRNMFYERYEHLLHKKRDADINWLVSDLLLFMDRPRSRFRILECKLIYEVFKKSHMIQQKIEKPHLRNRDLYAEFNVYWGSLTPEKRIQFINRNIIIRNYAI